MYIFKMLKGNEVIYVGRASCMKSRLKAIKDGENREAFKNMDKIVYGEIENEEEAKKYKDLLRNYYNPLYNFDNAKKELCTENFSDTLKYEVYSEEAYEKIYLRKLEKIRKSAFNKKQKVRYTQMKKEKSQRREFVKEKIKKIRIDENLSDDMGVFPLFYHSYYRRSQNKEKMLEALKNIFIIVSKGYSLKGIIAIKNIYIQLYEENTKTKITQENIDNIAKEYGDFSLYDVKNHKCSNEECNKGILFRSPCFFISSLNYEKYAEKLGFKLYIEDDYLNKLVIGDIEYSGKFCKKCLPIIRESELKYLEEEKVNTEKRKLYMEHGIGLSHDSKEYWETLILELDSEQKEGVKQNLECIIQNIKTDKKSAESSIEILYNLGFAKQIPDWVEKRKYVKGIIYIGNYYYEQSFIDAFNGLKNVKANEWY